MNAPVHGLILAGGLNTRLKPHTSVPKALVPIRRVPAISRLLTLMQQAGISEVVIATGYQGPLIEQFVGNGEKWGMKIRLKETDITKGNAYALNEGINALSDSAVHVFVCANDQVFQPADFILPTMIATHIELGSIITLAASPEETEKTLVRINDEDLESDALGNPRIRGGRVTGIYEMNVIYRNVFMFMLNIEKALPHIPERGDIFEHIAHIAKGGIEGKLSVFFHNGFWGHITDGHSIESIERHMPGRTLTDVIYPEYPFRTKERSF